MEIFMLNLVTFTILVLCQFQILNINGSLLPYEGFDGQFDIGK